MLVLSRPPRPFLRMLPHRSRAPLGGAAVARRVRPGTAQRERRMSASNSIPPFPVVYLQGTATLERARRLREIVVRVATGAPHAHPHRRRRIRLRRDQGCCSSARGLHHQDPCATIYVGEPVPPPERRPSRPTHVPIRHMSEPCFRESVELRFGAGAAPRTDPAVPHHPTPREHRRPHRDPTATPPPRSPSDAHARPHAETVPPTATPFRAEPTAAPTPEPSDGGGTGVIIVALVVLVGIAAIAGVGVVALRRRRS